MSLSMQILNQDDLADADDAGLAVARCYLVGRVEIDDVLPRVAGCQSKNQSAGVVRK